MSMRAAVIVFLWCMVRAQWSHLTAASESSMTVLAAGKADERRETEAAAAAAAALT